MNSKKFILIVLLLIIVSGLTWAGIFWWNNLRGAGPAIKPPPGDISNIIENIPAENKTDFPLTLPDNFKIEIFAKKLPGARVIVQDGLGNFWISQPARGTVSLLSIQDGKVVRVESIFRGLNKPHGLAIDAHEATVLYIAETDKISRVNLYSGDSLEKIVDLPGNDRHFSRTIEFGPDRRLYVSIGSSCDTCYEKDKRRAAIYSMNKDGSDFKLFANGLRNSVFFTWRPFTNDMWATEMGRDLLGDDLPPDEINIVKEGGNYGWPICYGKNIHDTKFDKNTYIRNPCEDKIPSYIDLQAHSAPLGLDFIPVPEEPPFYGGEYKGGKWPLDYRGDLLVAYHGSWNRTVPTGYKIVRFILDENGMVEGREDFISGWLTDEGALGRPVDILIQPDGVMYITDDKAGVVYKVSYISG